jgi:hypothetical protein
MKRARDEVAELISGGMCAARAWALSAAALCSDKLMVTFMECPPFIVAFQHNSAAPSRREAEDVNSLILFLSKAYRL